MRARRAGKFFGLMKINEEVIIVNNSIIGKWRYLENCEIRLTVCLSGQVRYTDSVSNVF